MRIFFSFRRIDRIGEFKKVQYGNFVVFLPTDSPIVSFTLKTTVLMGRHTFSEWFTATRYWSFPVSTMPVVATFAYLFSEGLIPSGPKPYAVLALSLLAVVCLHSAGNLLSDYYDYKRGVDNERAFAVPFLVHHKFEPKEYLVFSVVLFAVGALLGIVITLLSGPGLLLVGGAGIILTVLYSFLKYRALGDLDIFVIFGVLTVLGSSYAMTGEFVWNALVLSVPIGIITVAVLHANNTLDIHSDKEAGIRTFAMILGARTSCVLYCIYMILPFAAVVAAVFMGMLHPLSLLCVVAALPAGKNFSRAASYNRQGLEAIKGLDRDSAKLQLVFSGLLSLGLILGPLVF